MKAYSNRGLFSEDYLESRLTEYAEWEASVSEVYREFRDLYENKRGILEGLNEAQTEDEFFEPAFRLLGFKFIGQAAAGSKRPDYALFASEVDKKAARKAPKDEDKFYAPSLAIGEVKRWKRSLNVRESGDKKQSAPEMQIVGYLERTKVPWGILTNGAEWRLYHGDTTGTAKRYFTVDFEKALESEENFRWFYLFFRRESFQRDGVEGKCFLDRVLEGSEQYAVQVGKELKNLIFEKVFPLLAEGFIEDYRQKTGKDVDEETLQRVYRTTLAFLYRLLFLLYAEARDLLPIRDEQRYWPYSITKIKHDVAQTVKSGRVLASGTHSWWGDLKNLFGIVDQGREELNVPAYNGGLFKDDGNHEFLKDYRVSDRHLAPALDALSRQDGRFVDYGFVGVRELGSVYEGLLEFSLKVAAEDLVAVKNKKNSSKEIYEPASKHTGKTVVVEADKPYLVNDRKERKATGSYYTPGYIVDYIVANTLGPLVAERRAALAEALDGIASLQKELRRAGKSEKHIADEVRKRNALETLLDVKVLDPAMGSGHFLVAAVDYLTDGFIQTITADLDARPVTDELAALRKDIRKSLDGYGVEVTDEQLSDTRLLKRMVMKRCVYGVDLNEMAVELAKLSLWLDAFTVGAPLSFLDHHLKHGNSLIGSSVREVRREVESSGSLLGNLFTERLVQGTELMQQVGEITDATIGEVYESTSRYQEADRVLAPYKRMLDIWTSQHFGNKRAKNFLSETSATGAVEDLARGNYESFTGKDRETIEAAKRLAGEERLFHWELEFPEVFYERGNERENPGFDAVVGNPPYIRESGNKPLFGFIQRAELFKPFYRGKTDIYFYFIMKGTWLLRSERLLGYIVPANWLEAVSSAKLRVFLQSEAKAREVVTFGGLTVFEGASVESMILLAERLGSDHWLTHRYRLSQSKAHDVLETGPRVKVPAQLLAEEGWYLRTLPDSGLAPIFDKVESMGQSLGSLFHVEAGVNTGADVVSSRSARFWPAGVREGEGIFLLRESELSQLSLSVREVKHIKPYVSADRVDRYFQPQTADRFLIYLRNEIDVALLPNIESHLRKYKSILENRAEVQRNARRKWWHLLWPRDPRVYDASEKLVTPNATQSNSFSLDDQQTYYNIGCTVLALLPDVETSISCILAVLNSRLLDAYYGARGQMQSETQRKYFPDKVRRVPVPLISFTTPKAERRRAVEEAVKLYEAGDYAAVVGWAERELGWTAREGHYSGGRNDTVHDLLARLAREMMEMHGERAEAETTWREWVAAAMPTEYAKLTKTFRERGWAEDGCRAGWSGVLAGFQKKKAVSSGGLLQQLKRETEEVLGKVCPLRRRIEETDRLIDEVVYRLYGLTEEEISVVESGASAEAVS